MYSAVNSSNNEAEHPFASLAQSCVSMCLSVTLTFTGLKHHRFNGKRKEKKKSQ